MFEERDEKDLVNPDLAVYNFRGHTVFRYYKKGENGRGRRLELGNDAQMCMFIAEDFLRMAEFLQNCHKHQAGEIENVENVIVN